MVARVLTLQLWQLGPLAAARAAATSKLVAPRLRGTPGLLHAQPVATSDTVLLTPRRLGLMCAWEDAAAADAYLAGPDAAVRDRAAARSAVLRLQPVRAAGRWRGVTLATDDHPPLAPGEPVLAFVYGRLRPRYAGTFYRRNVRVARWARGHDGYLGAMGVHESPRRFASLSSWRSVEEMRRYAYGPGEHLPVVRPYKEVPWADGWCFARLRPLGPVDLLL